MCSYKSRCYGFCVFLSTKQLFYLKSIMLREDVAKIVALYEDGRSVRYIAASLNIARSTVHYAINRYRATGEFVRRAGSGRPRSTNQRDDRFIVSSVLRDRRLTSRIIAGRLAEVRGRLVSSKTISRRLKETGLRSRRPATGPVLLPIHRTARLRFALEHQNWTVEDWSSVLFTDESRVSLRSPDGRERVWRRLGERYAQCVISPRTPFHGRSLMIWAGISLEARTDLVIWERGAINAHRYIEDCLIPHVVPYAPFIGAQFVLMHDNARPHIANIVQRYLEDVEIRTLVWPARSPDINPIEHLWDNLKRRLRRRPALPETLQDLQAALREEWNLIGQEEVADLIRSMPRRMRDIIRARGGNTRY